jgi:hypothetical protein
VGTGEINLPAELQNIVVLHVGLEYGEYYDVIADMDICIPAFGTSDEYYTIVASSTVVMCSEVNVCYFPNSLRLRTDIGLTQVPILRTERMQEAYIYINDDRVSVTSPAVMTEMDAIIALRTQNASDFLASDPSKSGRAMGSNAAVRNAVEEMTTRGWIRSKAEFEDVKHKIWRANDLVVMKLLQGLR